MHINVPCWYRRLILIWFVRENWFEFIDQCYIVILCSPIFAPVLFHLSLFSWSYFCLFDFPEHEGDTIILSLSNIFDILKIRLVVLGIEFIKYYDTNEDSVYWNSFVKIEIWKCSKLSMLRWYHHVI